MHADPIARLCSAEGVSTRRQACVPSASVRVGLLINPHARRLRRRSPRERLGGLLGDPAAVVETRDLASLRRALARLLTDGRANVLAVAGGDGTVHHVVNALIQLDRESVDDGLGAPPRPRILILNGGTLNIVGRTVAIHGTPRYTLERFLAYFRGAPLSRVPARRLPLLEVRWGDALPRYGFVFGSEAPRHAIDLYTRYGAGYSGLSRFLFEVVRGVHGGSRLWQEEGWKLGPFQDLLVDDRRYALYTAAVASTVDLTLAVGAVRAIRRPLLAPGFFAKVVEETEPRRMVALLPRLMTERDAPGVSDHPNARRMQLFGPYTLDGESFDEPAYGARRLALTVGESQERLHAVPGELGAEEW